MNKQEKEETADRQRNGHFDINQYVAEKEQKPGCCG